MSDSFTLALATWRAHRRTVGESRRHDGVIGLTHEAARRASPRGFVLHSATCYSSRVFGSERFPESTIESDPLRLLLDPLEDVEPLAC